MDADAEGTRKEGVAMNVDEDEGQRAAVAAPQTATQVLSVLNALSGDALSKTLADYDDKEVANSIVGPGTLQLTSPPPVDTLGCRSMFAAAYPASKNERNGKTAQEVDRNIDGFTFWLDVVPVSAHQASRHIPYGSIFSGVAHEQERSEFKELFKSRLLLELNRVDPDLKLLHVMVAGNHVRRVLEDIEIFTTLNNDGVRVEDIQSEGFNLEIYIYKERLVVFHQHTYHPSAHMHAHDDKMRKVIKFQNNVEYELDRVIRQRLVVSPTADGVKEFNFRDHLSKSAEETTKWTGKFREKIAATFPEVFKDQNNYWFHDKYRQLRMSIHTEELLNSRVTALRKLEETYGHESCLRLLGTSGFVSTFFYNPDCLVTDGYATLATKKPDLLIAAMEAVKAAVDGDKEAMIRLMSTDGYASLATKKPDKLIAAMKAVKEAVDGDKEAMILLFSTGGYASRAVKQIPLLVAVMKAVKPAVNDDMKVVAVLFSRTGFASFAVKHHAELVDAIGLFDRERAFSAFSVSDIMTDIFGYSKAPEVIKVFIQHIEDLVKWFPKVEQIADDDITALCKRTDPQLARYCLYRGLVIQLVKKLAKKSAEEQNAHVARVTAALESGAHTEDPHRDFLSKMSKAAFGIALFSRHRRVKLQLAKYLERIDDLARYMRAKEDVPEREKNKMIESFKKEMAENHPLVALDIDELTATYPVSNLLADMNREANVETMSA